MSLDISRWWPWRVIFFYDSFVATKEGNGRLAVTFR